MVPSFGCKCREETTRLLRLYPPVFENFPLWAEFFHDEVNLSLGKSLWSSTHADTQRMLYATK